MLAAAGREPVPSPPYPWSDPEITEASAEASRFMVCVCVHGYCKESESWALSPAPRHRDIENIKRLKLAKIQGSGDGLKRWGR